MRISPFTRYALRTVALVYLFILLVVPVALIFWRSFEHGLGQFWEWITTPAAISALQLSLLIVAIVVPLNVVRRRDRPGADPRQLPRQGPAAVGRRPAIRGVAGRRRRRTHPAGATVAGSAVESLGFRVIFDSPAWYWRRCS